MYTPKYEKEVKATVDKIEKVVKEKKISQAKANKLFDKTFKEKMNSKEFTMSNKVKEEVQAFFVKDKDVSDAAANKLLLTSERLLLATAKEVLKTLKAL